MRLAKYLASCGLASRRHSEELIASGLIKVNHYVVQNPATVVDPEKDSITFKGLVIKQNKPVYYLLNKPAGFTTSRRDVHAHKLITDLVPNNPPVWPVGRLDRETCGLIILTNDGELTHKLTHPSFHKEKEYILTVDIKLKNSEIEEIKNGLYLEDGLIKPDSFEKIAEKTYSIVIHEGRKRLLRRLIAHFNKKVLLLKRVRLSILTLEGLTEGQYRQITADEIKELLKDV